MYSRVFYGSCRKRRFDDNKCEHPLFLPLFSSLFSFLPFSFSTLLSPFFCRTDIKEHWKRVHGDFGETTRKTFSFSQLWCAWKTQQTRATTGCSPWCPRTSSSIAFSPNSMPSRCSGFPCRRRRTSRASSVVMVLVPTPSAGFPCRRRRTSRASSVVVVLVPTQKSASKHHRRRRPRRLR